MESILLVYKTRTGFTKKYVDWITEAISCHPVPFDQISTVEMNNYDIIIYGAGMHAGRVLGLKEFKKVADLVGKRIVVFASGGAPCTEEITSKIKMDNFSTDELTRMEFFYFQSGLNYEKMSLSDKTIMKIYNKFLQLKNSKSEVEDGTSKAIPRSYDHSSSEYIKPMIDYLKGMLNK